MGRGTGWFCVYRDFGIFRPRSAIIFYWMCEVPPPITSPSENIHSYGQ